jgi:hypothetical protein
VGRDPGCQGKRQRRAEPHSDDSVGPEQKPAANGQQTHHAAEEKHRLQQVPQLVPALLARIERRKTTADHDLWCEHLAMEAGSRVHQGR